MTEEDVRSKLTKNVKMAIISVVPVEIIIQMIKDGITVYEGTGDNTSLGAACIAFLAKSEATRKYGSDTAKAMQQISKEFSAKPEGSDNDIET